MKDKQEEWNPIFFLLFLSPLNVKSVWIIWQGIEWY